MHLTAMKLPYFLGGFRVFRSLVHPQSLTNESLKLQKFFWKTFFVTSILYPIYSLHTNDAKMNLMMIKL